MRGFRFAMNNICGFLKKKKTTPSKFQNKKLNVKKTKKNHHTSQTSIVSLPNR